MAKVLVMDGYAGAFSNFREQLLRDLADQGHDVIACAPSVSAELQAVLASRGVEARSIDVDRKGMNAIRDIISCWKMVRLMRALRPDCVLLYSSKPIIYGTISASLARVSVKACFVTGLGFGFSGTSFRARAAGQIQRLLYRVAFRLCDIVFFQNPDDRQVFHSAHLMPRRMRVQMINGSGVDIHKFPHVPVAVADAHFLMIGRLLKSKGIVEYLTAARRLKVAFPRVKCSLVGWIDDDNPDSITAEELRELLVDSGVEFLGRLDDVRPALRACTVFVLPSYREGTPRSTLEALATGRAVITTDAPGCRETVKQGLNGFLVPVRDPDALFSAMSEFVVDPSKMREFGLESRRIAEARFDVHAVNRTIISALGLAEGSGRGYVG